MTGLFDDQLLFDEGRKKTERFSLGHDSLILREQFFSKAESDHYYSSLLQQTQWQQRERKMYDRMVPDPRLTAWFGETTGVAWPTDLMILKKRVEAAAAIHFDSVLLNLYRDGRDSVSWHSDTLPASGYHQPIASISFGQTRLFHVRHKYDKSMSSFTIPLTHGSFLLMPASMQYNWEHHIPKVNHLLAPRINLTFRITK